MSGRGNVKKRALKFDFLLRSLVQLQPVLATEIKVGLTADIAAFGRARPKLLKMQHLADEPPGALSQAPLDFRLRRGLRGNNPYCAIRKYGDRHGRASRELCGVIEPVV